MLEIMERFLTVLFPPRLSGTVVCLDQYTFDPSLGDGIVGTRMYDVRLTGIEKFERGLL